jgi:hypothetical protein
MPPHERNCGPPPPVIFSTVSKMVDTSRKLPSPSAAAWRIDAAALGGPTFVVMRLDEDEAREALAIHLVEIGNVPHTIAAERLVRSLPSESVSVIW